MRKEKQKTGGEKGKMKPWIPLGIIGILALAANVAYAQTPDSDNTTDWTTMHSNMQKTMNSPHEMQKMMEACENEMSDEHHSNQSEEENPNHMGMM